MYTFQDYIESIQLSWKVYILSGNVFNTSQWFSRFPWHFQHPPPGNYQKQTHFVIFNFRAQKKKMCAFSELLTLTQAGLILGYPEQCHNHYCQAQPQLKVKLSLKAELALVSINQATHPPAQPPTHPPTPIHPPVKVYLEIKSLTTTKFNLADWQQTQLAWAWLSPSLFLF
jgi:hypothetical protein